MKQYHRMMVCLSNTEQDGSLIRYATIPAQIETLRDVLFVHVLPPHVDKHDGIDVARRVAMDRIRSEVSCFFVDVPSDTSTTVDVLTGPLLDRLLKYAADWEIDLIMVGHQLSHPRRGALGRRLAMKAPSSVWMVPAEASPTIRRILVPFDFSSHSAEAIPVATELARALGGAECLALYVYLNESPSEYEEYEELVRGHEDQVLTDFLSSTETHGIKVSPIFAEGMDVAEVIQDVAQKREVDVIVMSTRGRSRSAAILLGSVPEQVIIDSPCPLLVVKHFGARL